MQLAHTVQRNTYLRAARADVIGIPSPPTGRYTPAQMAAMAARPSPPTGRTVNMTQGQIQSMLAQHGNNVASQIMRPNPPTPPGGSRAPAYAGAYGGGGGGGYPAPPPRQLPSATFGVDSGATLIATTASATINVQPQQRCVPTTMTLTELIAETFIAANLTVGVKPLLITTGNISLAQFVQNSTAPTFTRIMLTPGVLFSILVTNISGASARFIANVQAEDWDEVPRYDY